MASLGFTCSNVVGHDRGSLTASVGDGSSRIGQAVDHNRWPSSDRCVFGRSEMISRKSTQNPVAIWKSLARDAEGFGIDSGHHVAEENPEALASAISNFLAKP